MPDLSDMTVQEARGVLSDLWALISRPLGNRKAQRIARDVSVAVLTGSIDGIDPYTTRAELMEARRLCRGRSDILAAIARAEDMVDRVHGPIATSVPKKKAASRKKAANKKKTATRKKAAAKKTAAARKKGTSKKRSASKGKAAAKKK